MFRPPLFYVMRFFQFQRKDAIKELRKVRHRPATTFCTHFLEPVHSTLESAIGISPCASSTLYRLFLSACSS